MTGRGGGVAALAVLFVACAPNAVNYNDSTGGSTSGVAGTGTSSGSAKGSVASSGASSAASAGGTGTTTGASGSSVSTGGRGGTTGGRAATSSSTGGTSTGAPVCASEFQQCQTAQACECEEVCLVDPAFGMAMFGGSVMVCETPCRTTNDCPNAASSCTANPAFNGLAADGGFIGTCTVQVCPGGAVVGDPCHSFLLPDEGTSDAGTVDGGLVDGGRDAGVLDAGMDAGAADSGALDSGLTDAGPDAGLPDAGRNAGLGDAGTSDAGIDAGVVLLAVPGTCIPQSAVQNPNGSSTLLLCLPDGTARTCALGQGDDSPLFSSAGGSIFIPQASLKVAATQPRSSALFCGAGQGCGGSGDGGACLTLCVGSGSGGASTTCAGLSNSSLCRAQDPNDTSWGFCQPCGASGSDGGAAESCVQSSDCCEGNCMQGSGFSMIGTCHP